MCRFVDLRLPDEPLGNLTWLKRLSVVVIVPDSLLFVVVVLNRIEVLLPEIEANVHELLHTFFVDQLDHVVPHPFELQKNLFGRFFIVHQVVRDLMDFLLGEHVSDHESVSLQGGIHVHEFGEVGAHYFEEVVSAILLVHVDHLPP